MADLTYIYDYIKLKMSIHWEISFYTDVETNLYSSYISQIVSM